MFKREKLSGNRAGVLGLGKSGRAVATLLAQNGFDVLISEEAPVAHAESFLFPKGVRVETGGHSADLFKCNFWIKSPGILPHSHPLVEAKKQGIPVYSELETALAFMPKGIRVFAVTGTNGKTTTTALLGEILKLHAVREGKNRQVFVCGNIGSPVSLCANQVKKGDDVVIEVSSYQLEDSTYFRPNFACILNVTPDHLDHHGGMKNYIKAKAKVFKNQRAGDVLVVNGADTVCAERVEKVKSKVLAFSTHPKQGTKSARRI